MAEPNRQWKAGTIEEPVAAWQRPVGGVVPTPAFEGYLTKEDVARGFRVPVRTVERWMVEGVVPFYKRNRAVRFRWSEVQAHWAARYRVCVKQSAAAATQLPGGIPKR